MKEMAQDRIALDRAAVSARTLDPHSGHLHVAQTNISKATVNPYNGSEIPGADELGLDPNRVYQLLRHPDELEKAAKSFNGKPLVMIHRAQATDDKDHENRVGSVGNVVYDHPYLKADLAVWAKEAIDAIEDGTQRELSCGYAYRPVMTPGTFEGQRYDGIMTAIGGNHVALVKEGRAGADCHVFDSIEGLKMTKTAMKPRAAMALGTLTTYLRPKLAKDAKIDWTPTFKGLSFADPKATKASLTKIATDAKLQTKDKLGKDQSIEDIAEVLETLAPIIEQIVDEDPAVVPPVVDPAADADMTALLDALKAAGFSEEDIAKIMAMKDAPDAPPPAASDAEKKDDADSKSEKKDDMGKDTKNMVTKTAMDAAIASAVAMATKNAISAATKTQTDIRVAFDAVRPHVGSLTIAATSAEDVYKAALECKGIAFDGLPPAAYKAFFENVMTAQAAAKKPNTDKFAQDAAAAKSAAERYGFGRIGHAA